MSREVTFAALVTAVSLLGGCALRRTDYERPAVAAPAEWAHAPAAAAGATENTAAVPDAWWAEFQDAQLTALVERALRTNNDLAAATARVRQAQALAGLARNDLFPQISAGASASRQKPLDGGDATRSYGASLAASYELDLWGRLTASRDAARWEARATAEDREATALTLVGTAIHLHFLLGYLDDRLALDDETLADAKRTLSLVETQYRAGAASGLELAEARTVLANQEAARTLLAQQRVEAGNALDVLLDGSTPSPYEPASPAAAPLPAVAPGLPAEILSRRPDLRAAEARLRATLASRDAANAAFYPALVLTGEVGGSSDALRKVLSDPVGVLSASLSLPFLNFDRVRLTRAVTRAQYEEAVAGFRQAFRQALADVDNALSAGTQLQMRQEQLERALTDARTAERLYEIRYRAGAVPLRDWLSAQGTRRSAEAAALENRLAQLDNRTLLFQSLGGSSPR